MLRFIILATIASVGLSLACSPAMAEEPQEGSSTTAIQTAQNTVVPLPTTLHHGRLSTRDRWRGRPYLRSSADETVRSHALDVALPPANGAFQGGVTLQPPGTFASEHAVRTEALDKALLPVNSSFVGGSTGGFGF